MKKPTTESLLGKCYATSVYTFPKYGFFFKICTLRACENIDLRVNNGLTGFVLGVGSSCKYINTFYICIINENRVDIFLFHVSCTDLYNFYLLQISYQQFWTLNTKF